MSSPKQVVFSKTFRHSKIHLIIFLLIFAVVLTLRFYPPSHAILAGLGVPLSSAASAEVDDMKAAATPGNGTTDGQGPGGGANRAAVVTTSPVTRGTTNDRLEAVGSGDATKSVSVVPLTSGVLTVVAVVSGDTVKAGDLLAHLNSQGEEISREQAVVALRAAEDILTRYRSLWESNIASQVELNDLQTAYDAAELALKEAEVDLQRRSIFAPIDGVVGIVPVEVGDYVTTQTEIAMIDDRSQIIVDFWVPERFAGAVEIGQIVAAQSFAFANEVFHGEVSAISSRVETDSRTLQLQARIDNADDRLRPGMSFAISMGFAGDQFPAVDPLALRWDENGSYVWTVDDDLAKRTPVRIVQRNPGSVLVDGDLTEGANVIIQGLLGLRDGAAVRILGSGITSEPARQITRQEGRSEDARPNGQGS